MDKLEEFKAIINSCINKAYDGGVALLGFLDESKQAMIKSELKWHSEIIASFEGGIVNSYRKRCIIAPKGYSLDFKISIYQIKYNKRYYNINHRDVLGSLMALGIKRSVIGDITIDENNEIFFACTTDISLFLEAELKTVGGAHIELIECHRTIENVVKKEEKKYFIASARLDVVVAEGFKLSRAEAQEAIKAGLVFVNYLECLNVSYIVKELDQISLRKKGKIILEKLGEKTKGGRIVATISKLL